MKLNIVPARTGIQWVKLGCITFFKQPLALAGLFFMFMATMSVLSIVPVLGNALALALLPAATLGLMVATQEAARGKFPMPSIMLAAFKAAKPKMQAMLMLGVIYAVSFMLVMGVSTLFDGGKFAKLYLIGGSLSRELVMDGEFQTAMWVSMALYLPLAMLFWHAPALVYWQGMAPVKSLFFSLVACIRNFRAFLVYGFAWVGLFVVVSMGVTTIAGIIGGAGAATAAMFPAAMLLAAMFFTSVYFSVKDCFEASTGETV